MGGSRMMYVRCINNRGYEASLTMDSVYKVLPAPHDKTSWRVFDNEGEDYLYDTSRFEQVQVTAVHDKATESVTVHLAPLLKRILRAEALAAQTSVSGLLRNWIDEHLDLPVAS